jgi:hypothetical protein
MQARGRCPLTRYAALRLLWRVGDAQGLGLGQRGIRAGRRAIEPVPRQMPSVAIYQLSRPTPTLQQLYAEVPRWAHTTLNSGPRLSDVLTLTVSGAQDNQSA